MGVQRCGRSARAVSTTRLLSPSPRYPIAARNATIAPAEVPPKPAGSTPLLIAALTQPASTAPLAPPPASTMLAFMARDRG